ncbi:MAG: Bax inhibitor-1/YccA family protein [Flavobacteriales bacterium]
MNTPSSFQNDAFGTSAQAGSKAFISSVFTYMTFALLISGTVAWLGAGSQWLLDMMMTPFSYVIMLAPLAAVLVMSIGFNKLSYTALVTIFFVYSGLMGLSLSAIFWVYDLGTIFKVFFITAGLFTTMAVLGYTTKTDLTRMGGILMMAVIGIVIASIVNWFLKSSAFDYLISCVGVLVFTGLTAYDMQKIKRIGEGVEYGTATTSKLAVMGALTLYLDFVNLFLMLLRVFGRRD